MRSLIVPFHHYSGTQKESILDLFVFFMKKIERAAFDQIFVIDSGSILPEIPDERVIHIHVNSRSHWDNLDIVLPRVVMESEGLLLLDCDTIVHDADKIDWTFDLLNSCPIASALDNSGSVDMGERFPEFRANPSRGEVRRFTPYFFMAKSSFLADIPVATAPTENPDGFAGFMDSFGYYSFLIAQKLKDEKQKFLEIPDDRWTCHFNDGDFSSTNFSFEGTLRAAEKPHSGWYHLRNFGHGLRLRDTFLTDKEEFAKMATIMPQNEIARLLMWVKFISPKYGVPDELLKFIHIDVNMWKKYEYAFTDLHPWIERFL